MKEIFPWKRISIEEEDNKRNTGKTFLLYYHTIRILPILCRPMVQALILPDI